MERILTKEDFGIGGEAVVLEDGDKYFDIYGMENGVVTDEDIKALQEGKALLFSVFDEYTILLTKKEV